MSRASLLLSLMLVAFAAAKPEPQLGDLLKSAGDSVLSSVTSVADSVTSIWDDCKKGKEVFKTDPAVAAVLFTDEGCENTDSVTSIWDDCKKGKEVFKTDPAVAAVLFTDEGCENTDIQIREGFTDLPFTKKNRGEAIMVREGCVCVAFDHSDKSGKSAVFDNGNGKSILIQSELKDGQLGEDISALDCRCGSAAKKAAHIEPITKAEDCDSNCLKRCNRFVGQFNRVDLPKDKDICAVLFDEDECDGWNRPVAQGFESFNILSKYRNDAESIIVKPGCIFTGYDNTDKSGNRVIVDAKAAATSTTPIYKQFKDSKDLREEISAVECVC